MIKSARGSSGQAPLIIGAGYNVRSTITNVAVAYGIQALINGVSASAAKSKQDEGGTLIYNAAVRFKQMIEDFRNSEFYQNTSPKSTRDRRPEAGSTEWERWVAGQQQRTQQQAAQASAVKTDYEILEVSPNASHEQIDTAYRRLSQMYHPDKVESLAPGYKANYVAKMKEINAAYERLKVGVYSVKLALRDFGRVAYMEAWMLSNSGRMFVRGGSHLIG